MAHKKGGGSSHNNRHSNAQRLGVKRFGGQEVTAGSILVRQRGAHYPVKMLALGKTIRCLRQWTALLCLNGPRRSASR